MKSACFAVGSILLCKSVLAAELEIHGVTVDCAYCAEIGDGDCAVQRGIQIEAIPCPEILYEYLLRKRDSGESVGRAELSRLVMNRAASHRLKSIAVELLLTGERAPLPFALSLELVTNHEGQLKEILRNRKSAGSAWRGIQAAAQVKREQSDLLALVTARLDAANAFEELLHFAANGSAETAILRAEEFSAALGPSDSTALKLADWARSLQNCVSKLPEALCDEANSGKSEGDRIIRSLLLQNELVVPGPEGRRGGDPPSEEDGKSTLTLGAALLVAVLLARLLWRGGRSGRGPRSDLISSTLTAEEEQRLVHACAVIDVPPWVDRQSLKRSYRRKVKQLHPDTGSGSVERLVLTRQAYEQALRLLERR